jgi:hypothetical protein
MYSGKIAVPPGGGGIVKIRLNILKFALQVNVIYVTLTTKVFLRAKKVGHQRHCLDF